jgi:[ribosomal protein S5]-alanine N-acetyltransferase
MLTKPFDYAAQSTCGGLAQGENHPIRSFTPRKHKGTDSQGVSYNFRAPATLWLIFEQTHSKDASNMDQHLPNISTCFETERLLVRCFQPGDETWYFPMSRKNRSHLMQYESGNMAMSINSQEDAERVVREMTAGWADRKFFFMGAFDKVTGEFVAQVYIGPANWDLPEFEVGYFADRDHEGQGYVTEAVQGALRFIFEKMNARRVRLECDDTNMRSLRVAERCGMVREGHIRENRKNPDGTYSGTLHYGLLRREYEARSSK